MNEKGFDTTRRMKKQCVHAHSGEMKRVSNETVYISKNLELPI